MCWGNAIYPRKGNINFIFKIVIYDRISYNRTSYIYANKAEE